MPDEPQLKVPRAPQRASDRIKEALMRWLEQEM
jgi:hypothetical protein